MNADQIQAAMIAAAQSTLDEFLEWAKTEGYFSELDDRDYNELLDLAETVAIRSYRRASATHDDAPKVREQDGRPLCNASHVVGDALGTVLVCNRLAGHPGLHSAPHQGQTTWEQDSPDWKTALSIPGGGEQPSLTTDVEQWHAPYSTVDTPAAPGNTVPWLTVGPTDPAKRREWAARATAEHVFWVGRFSEGVFASEAHAVAFVGRAISKALEDAAEVAAGADDWHGMVRCHDCDATFYVEREDVLPGTGWKADGGAK